MFITFEHIALHAKWSFPLKFSLAHANEIADSDQFLHIY